MTLHITYGLYSMHRAEAKVRDAHMRVPQTICLLASDSFHLHSSQRLANSTMIQHASCRGMTWGHAGGKTSTLDWSSASTPQADVGCRADVHRLLQPGILLFSCANLPCSSHRLVSQQPPPSAATPAELELMSRTRGPASNDAWQDESSSDNDSDRVRLLLWFPIVRFS